MDTEPNKEKHRKREQYAYQRVDTEPRIELVNEISPEHEESGMCQIHNLHDAVDDGHTD